MLGKERFTGTEQKYLVEYHSDQSLGKAIRQSDAVKMLREMKSDEKEVLHREKILAECNDRILRMNEQHRLNMDYLISYGIHAQRRETLTEVLEEVQEHGGLSVREAINLANARAQHSQQFYNSNGLSTDSSGLATS